MVGIGAALLAGSLAGGQPLLGAILFAALGGSGAFMAWIGRGWDKPLESTDELHRFGRPANATVEKVEDVRLEPNGTRTAKLKLHVRPLEENLEVRDMAQNLLGG